MSPASDPDRSATPPAPGAVWVQPGAGDVVVEAVRAAGATVAADPHEARALVWHDKDVEALRHRLHPSLAWVQLPDAGVERWLDAGVLGAGPVFTSARGCFGPQVAEHALALLLAGARRLPECAALRSWPAQRPTGASLHGAVVLVVGAGDIGTCLTAQLDALGARVHILSRSGRAVPGATASHRAEQLDALLPTADHVVLAAPSTPQTRHLMDARRLALMAGHAWLVNVARGDLVHTDALVDALEHERLGGAALDVTDPEPLPDDHPLWDSPRALITPHVANPPALKARSLAARVGENTRRFLSGAPLLGRVDEEAGY